MDLIRCQVSAPAAVVFMLLVGLVAGSGFISGGDPEANAFDDVFASHGSGGRNLLQAKTSCPVNFEFLNYTVITSKCKGPKYPADLCCSAFKEFACPYSEQLNDGTNDCASTMFSYINLYGKYPPGLFASECREGKEGLACPADAPQSADEEANTAHINQRLGSLLILVFVMILSFLLY